MSSASVFIFATSSSVARGVADGRVGAQALSPGEQGMP
jgi:hypothetical protein